MPGWIGVDLDGTLAQYHGFKGPEVIGEPIPEMLDKVKQMLADGVDVRIFTARVYSGMTEDRNREARLASDAISAWCMMHLGRVIPITCVKDYGMYILYDDRAVQVQRNTGRILGDEAGALENIKAE